MESDNKVVYIHTTTQGDIKVYSRLDVLEADIKDERFLRCHQSYLVNLQYVAGLVDSDFIMIDDSMIPIRKSGRKLIVKKYEEFLKETLQKEEARLNEVTVQSIDFTHGKIAHIQDSSLLCDGSVIISKKVLKICEMDCKCNFVLL